MSPETKKLLEEFAGKANWNTPGSVADMGWFWNFVISAYRHDEWGITLDEFLNILGRNKDGVILPGRELTNRKKELASKMFMHTKYEDGIKLLRIFENK